MHILLYWFCGKLVFEVQVLVLSEQHFILIVNKVFAVCIMHYNFNKKETLK